MADNEESKETAPEGNEGNEEHKETAPKGNEWEVVSLTASAYAAAPGPEQVGSSEDIQENYAGEREAETSHAMFMSKHFVFPPSQHENLPLQPKFKEMPNEKEDEGDFSSLTAEEGGKLNVKDEERMSIEELMSHEFPGVQVFDEKDNSVSVSGSEFQKDVAFDYSAPAFSALHSMSTTGRSDTSEEGVRTDNMADPVDQASDSSLPDSPKPVEEDKYDGVDLPCDAWWKRRALSLYAQAKEANTFWSILIAAAFTGLVVIGHKWQQERWQILQLKWQFGLSDEKMGRILGPISRFKDVIVGGSPRGSLIRGSNSAER